MPFPKSSLLRLALLASFLGSGCTITAKGQDTGTTETNADTGDDSDTDVDTGAGFDTGIDVAVDCDDAPEPETWDSTTCVTATIGCGESLLSTIEGGTSLLSGAQYASYWACAVVGPQSYRGTERMFAFQHPGTGWATITLVSPCDNLDLFAAYWEDESCLDERSVVTECEGDTSGGGGWVRIWNNRPRRYVLVVEGPEGEEAPFGIGVSCG